MAELAALAARVHGRVQGVNFRKFVAQQANSLGVTGFVRNLPDGTSLEVKAEGEKGKLEELLEKLQEGPPLARVERVEAAWSSYAKAFPRFEVR